MARSIPISWFKRMDMIHSEKFRNIIISELACRTYLKDRLGNLYNKFIKWACLERMHFEPDIDDEVNDFLSLRKRMSETNVKEWYKLINKVFKRDNYTCSYCGNVGGSLEADHIIPFSKGGDDTLENLTTSCQKCNRQKIDKTVSEYLKWKEHA